MVELCINPARISFLSPEQLHLCKCMSLRHKENNDRMENSVALPYALHPSPAAESLYLKDTKQRSYETQKTSVFDCGRVKKRNSRTARCGAAGRTRGAAAGSALRLCTVANRVGDFYDALLSKSASRAPCLTGVSKPVVADDRGCASYEVDLWNRDTVASC